MALSSEDLKSKSDADEKGKAVLVLHTWKDHLWEMGQKGDVPPSAPLVAGDKTTGEDEDVADESGEQNGESKETKQEQGEEVTDAMDSIPKIAYNPQEITELLTKSLIHAIANQLSSLPKASFPIPASHLYTTYILPCRPAYPPSVLVPSAASTDENKDVDPEEIHIDPSEITIKASTYKSLSSFLKAAEKSSLLTLKPPKQKSGGGDVLITSVNAEHADVVSYKMTKRLFVIVAEIEAKRAKRQAKEAQAEKERERSEKEVEIRQTWKPHLGSMSLFEDMDARQVFIILNCITPNWSILPIAASRIFSRLMTSECSSTGTSPRKS
jgi:translation initiation factor 2D